MLCRPNRAHRLTKAPAKVVNVFYVDNMATGGMNVQKEATIKDQDPIAALISIVADRIQEIETKLDQRIALEDAKSLKKGLENIQQLRTMSLLLSNFAIPLHKCKRAIAKDLQKFISHRKGKASVVEGHIARKRIIRTAKQTDPRLGHVLDQILGLPMRDHGHKDPDTIADLDPIQKTEEGREAQFCVSLPGTRESKRNLGLQKRPKIIPSGCENRNKREEVDNDPLPEIE